MLKLDDRGLHLHEDWISEDLAYTTSGSAGATLATSKISGRDHRKEVGEPESPGSVWSSMVPTIQYGWDHISPPAMNGPPHGEATSALKSMMP